MYEYLAEVLRVIDGDTIECSIDLGFGIRWRQPVRLDGINAPELHGVSKEEKELAIAAKQYLEQLINGHSVRLMTSKPKEKYGRYLAIVWLQGLQAQSVNEQMILAGHARPYDGGKRYGNHSSPTGNQTQRRHNPLRSMGE